MIIENKDKELLLKDSREYEGTIPICDWRKLICSVRAFAKIIGVSPAMVIRLRKLGVIKQSREGVKFLPSILDYCKTYLIPSEFEKLLKRHGKTLEKILQAKKMADCGIFSHPSTWNVRKIRITLPFDVCKADSESIKKIALAAMDGQEPFTKAVKINFVFYRKCKRISEKYGACYEFASNISKIFEGVIYQNDFQIVESSILKLENNQPRIEITILEMDTNDF